MGGRYAEAGAEHPAREAVAAVALVDGLGSQFLFGDGKLTPEAAIAVLDAHLARALPG